MKNHQETIKKIVKILKNSKSILFITGAGISADSGLPTYRGIGGLYNDSLTEEGISIETALAGETLRNSPGITWKYLSQIEKNCSNAKFNKAHKIIAGMEKHFSRVWVLTQNIDGFHHSAGSNNIIDIHGDMHKLRCMKCDWKKVVSNYDKLSIPPICPKCGNFIRPDVVLFGEMLDAEKLTLLENELTKGFDIYFSVGTTSIFPYIQQPILIANRVGKPTVEINLGETEVSDFMDFKLRMRAAEALDAIWNEYNSVLS